MECGFDESCSIGKFERCRVLLGNVILFEIGIIDILLVNCMLIKLLFLLFILMEFILILIVTAYYNLQGIYSKS